MVDAWQEANGAVSKINEDLGAAARIAHISNPAEIRIIPDLKYKPTATGWTMPHSVARCSLRAGFAN
jgi:hypothetical protein